MEINWVFSSGNTTSNFKYYWRKMNSEFKKRISFRLQVRKGKAASGMPVYFKQI